MTKKESFEIDSMNILLVTEFFPENATHPILTGGVEARTYHLFRWLSKHHRVTVWKRTGRYRFNSSALLVIERVWFVLRTIWYGVRTRERYDIVEGTNALTYPLAYLVARRTGAKAVAWVPDLFGRYATRHIGFINGFFIRCFEWLSCSLSWDGIIALSEETKKKILSTIPGRRFPVRVIYGGVEPPMQRLDEKPFNHFGQRPIPRSASRRGITILTISRLVPYKRVDLVLLACYLVRPCIPALRLVIVGDGPEKSRLKRLAQQLDIDAIIIWKSRISEEEKRTLLSRSHLHILPSEFEGMGLVTLESLVVGTPVVTGDIPINKEVLQGEQGGLLFPKGDYVELAHAITRLLSDRTLYGQKMKQARELIKQYHWDNINLQTERFYKLVSKLTPGHCEESSTRQSTFSIRSPRLSEEPRDDF